MDYGCLYHFYRSGNRKFNGNNHYRSELQLWERWEVQLLSGLANRPLPAKIQSVPALTPKRRHRQVIN